MEHKYSVAQFSMSDNYDENIAKADKMIEKAAKEGAELLLLPELFEGLYFCQVEDYEKYSLAEEAKNSKTLAHFQEMAKKYHIVLPISFFEKSGPVYFNSLAWSSIPPLDVLARPSAGISGSQKPPVSLPFRVPRFFSSQARLAPSRFSQKIAKTIGRTPCVAMPRRTSSRFLPATASAWRKPERAL